MKQLFFFILTVISAVGSTQPPTEDCGDPTTSTSVSAYNGWLNQGVLNFSGNAEVQNTQPSNNRLGSGGGNIYFAKVLGTYFEMSGFPTTPQAPDNIEVIFGMHNYDTTRLNELLLEYSIDGLTYLPLNYRRYLPMLYAPTPWATMQAVIPKGIDPVNLRLRFTQNSSDKEFRLDDIFLRYYYLLPIRLQQFSATSRGHSVQLFWAASSHNNQEVFYVEKGRDGIHFTTISEQTAKGRGTFTYQLIDDNALNALAYYRLKMINEDGSFTYSYILRVQPKLDTKNILLNVYPLPAKDKLNFQIESSETAKATASITDLSGKTMLIRSLTLVEGINTVSINIQQIQKGLYLLKVATKETSETRKIIIE